MFAYLDGSFTYKSPALLHVEACGVGYEVHITLTTYSSVQSLDGGRLFTHLQIKEDAHTLYGFFTLEEREMFRLLISVSGVGAATARMMLSSLRSTEVAAAISNGNLPLLQGIKGIGKKTAERLILELKDKTAVTGGFGEYKGSQPLASGIDADALHALIALGINKSQAEMALKKVNQTQPGIVHLEDLIKKALNAI